MGESRCGAVHLPIDFASHVGTVTKRSFNMTNASHSFCILSISTEISRSPDKCRHSGADRDEAVVPPVTRKASRIWGLDHVSKITRSMAVFWVVVKREVVKGSPCF